MLTKKKTQEKYQRTFYIMLLLTLAGIFLAACIALKNTPTASPVTTPTKILVLETNTLAPTASPRPTSTIAPTPTPDHFTVLASEFNVPTVCLFNHLVSNDGNWIGADCKLFREFIIADKFSGDKTIIPYKEIDENAPRDYSVRPLSWSSDNRYFYFTTRCCEYDDSRSSNGNLYKFDTEERSWGILIRAVFEPSYFFSDNGERFIYINQYPKEPNYGYPEHLEIGMIDTELNKSKRLVLKDYWGPPFNEPTTYEWNDSNSEFGIVISRPTFHPHEVSYDYVLLKADFTKMEMQLIEEFNIENLLED